jgi:hypothetical protein
MPPLFSPVYSPTCLLHLQSFFIYSLHGEVPLPTSSGVFHMTTTVTSFPTPRLLGGGRHSCLLWLACLFTVPCGTAPLPLSELRAPSSLCYISFFSQELVYYSVCFFPLWAGGTVCPGVVLTCPRVVCGSTAYCIFAHLMVCISEAGKELASGGMGALLVSLFNVKWGCRAWAGGVEVLEFCLFLVFFPARCTSSISPRFYFRKHVFWILPLVAILESFSFIF